MRNAWWVVAFVALAGCFGGDDGRPDGSSDDGGGDPEPARGEPVEVVLSGVVPVALAPLPAGGVLVAGLDGAVWWVDADDRLAPEPVKVLPSLPPQGEKGLLGLTLGPAFGDEPWVYAFYTDSPATEQTQRIVRFRFDAGTGAAGPEEDVVTGLPASAGCCHNGGRVAFGPDGMLHVGIGDTMIAAESQRPDSLRGKLLRYTPTGGVPADNPIPGSPVVVSGLRNPFGLWLDAELGLVVTDNGPSAQDGGQLGGMDEVNLFQRGDNGGWPAGRGDQHLPGHRAPLWHSGDAHTAPTGVVVPRTAANETLNGLVVWCNYNQDEAWALDPAAADPQPVVVHEPCRYDVQVDARGRLVLATDAALRFVP